ncbi:Fur family transcriptional regulator [Oerskovia douganii]|uniref:Fur family transcriptional regulator n=1 Tax=Oerskovia douganii TaxID=2762210 RepID=UPI002AB1E9B4|nr:Fur family transcriptional regulator [Oerskovia douganii]
MDDATDRGTGPGPGGDRPGPGRVEEALGLLRSGGHRVTEARRAVLEVLATGEGHPSADELCARVHERHPGIHRATVYRTVDRLTTLGVLTHVHIGGGATAYHLAAGSPAREHLHAICDVCGRIIDLPGDLLDPVTTWLATEAGFTLAPAHVALSGTCATCRTASHVPDGP